MKLFVSTKTILWVLILLVLFSFSSHAVWWNFSQPEQPPSARITSIAERPIPDDRNILFTESLDELLIQGTATWEQVPIILVEITLDGGETWQEIDLVDETWSFVTSLIPEDEFLIQVLATDALGQVSVLEEAIFLSYYPLPGEAVVTDILNDILAAYRNQDIQDFMAFISADFYGGLDTIRDGVASDFDVFQDVRLEFSVSSIHITRNQTVVEAQWLLIYQRQGEDVTRRKDGSTVLTFTPSLELLSMRGDPIFGTTSPFIEELSGTEIEYSLMMQREGEGSTRPSRGEHLYSPGTKVEITATPAEGWYFSHLSGSIETEEIPTTLTMDADKIVRAVFKKIHYTLTVHQRGEGEVTPTLGPHSIPALTIVELKAIPEENWFFSQWEGAVKDPENPITTLLMEDDEEVTAVFEPVARVETPVFHPPPDSYLGAQEIIITTGTENADIYFTTDGSTPHKDHGTLYTEPVSLLEDTLIQAVAIKEGMVDSTIESGEYQIRYQLSLTIFPETGGSVDFEPDKDQYSYNERVTITAEPNPGFEFSHWEGDASGEEETISVTIDDHLEIIAVFKGQVRSPVFSPTPGSYLGAQEITITTETENADIYFTTDESTPHKDHGTLYTEPVSLLKDTLLQAVAIKEGMVDSTVESGEYQIRYQLSLTIFPETGGSVDFEPDKDQYSYNERVTITAEPNPGYEFSHWEGDASGEEETISVTIDDHLEITAVFKGQVKSPVFSPTPGSYLGAQEITIATETENADIYFTTDESTPHKDHGTLYTEPVSLLKDTLLQAVAIKEGMVDSTVESGEYQIRYTIETTISPENGGTIQLEPQQDAYQYEDKVTVTAEPNPGFEFSHWEGDASGEEKTISVTIDDHLEITAVFLSQPVLTLTITGDGKVWAKINDGMRIELEAGVHPLPRDASLLLEAEPELGWRFLNWEGDGEAVYGSPQLWALKMNEDREVLVIFTEKVPEAIVKAEFLEFGPSRIYTLTVHEVLFLPQAYQFSIIDDLEQREIGVTISRNSLEKEITLFIFDQDSLLLAKGTIEFHVEDTFEGAIDLELDSQKF